MPESFVRGLSTAHIPGRAQIVHDTYPESNNSLEVFENSCGDLTFYLDGAHSPESMEESNKLIKQVKIHDKQPGVVS